MEGGINIVQGGRDHEDASCFLLFYIVNCGIFCRERCKCQHSNYFGIGQEWGADTRNSGDIIAFCSHMHCGYGWYKRD